MNLRDRSNSFLIGLCAFVLLFSWPPTSALGQGATSAAVIQSYAPGSDAQAATLASQAIAVLVGRVTVHDVTLTGTASWGSDNANTGTVTLHALGTNESRVDLALPDGTRTEIRDASAGYAEGKWINPDGTSGQFAGHNTLTDAVWFFPAFSSLVANPNVVLSYVGLENRNGQSVQHLRSSIYQSSPPPDPSLTEQQLSKVDFYLDAGTFLPVAVMFNQHPDNNARVNIPVEIAFSNYQAMSGVLVPMHIQKSANGATILDITITGAVFNSGLTISEFSVN